MSAGIGDPSLNPWLRPFKVTATDEVGLAVVEFAQNLGPPLYFWLGRDAYPEWLLVHGMIKRSTAPITTNLYAGWTPHS